MQKNSPVNYGPVILQLIERVQNPKLVVVIPCCGHQEENSQITQGDKKQGRSGNKENSHRPDDH